MINADHIRGARRTAATPAPRAPATDLHRSFLVQRPPLRGLLTKALTERFETQPDGLPAFALIRPAIYARNARLVERLQAHLRDNDPFLHQVQATQIDACWRPYIRDVLAAEGGDPEKPVKKGSRRYFSSFFAWSRLALKPFMTSSASRSRKTESSGRK